MALAGMEGDRTSLGRIANRPECVLFQSGVEPPQSKALRALIFATLLVRQPRDQAYAFN
jgi:hypothetical protein